METSDDNQSLIKEKDLKRYKSYCDEVSTALKAFDKANEWADLLKYLQKLENAIDKDKKNDFPVIPEKILFAKRISQCLSAALPSGVHAKALEVLDKVYGKLDPTYMARNLDVSFGVFPLFRTASINIKSVILSLIERRFIPLGASLSVLSDSFLIAFLPGVEETNSETYPRAFALLEAFRSAVGVPQFYSSLWMALLKAPHVRIAGLAFLRLQLPKPGVRDGCDWCAEMAPFLPEKDTLVLQALRMCLSDNTMLVQRETLDLLVTHFRIDSGMFEESCLNVLVQAALLLVLKTEASLNRRLFAWLLGCDTPDGPPQNSDYFSRYARAPTLAAIEGLFARSMRTANSTDADTMIAALGSGSTATISPEAARARFVLRPVSVLEQLVAKDEIGGQIIGDVLPSVLELMWMYRPEGALEPRSVLTKLQEFVDMLELRVLWGHLAEFAKVMVSKLVAGDCAEFRKKFSILSATLDSLPPPADKSEVEALVTTYYPALLVTIIELLPSLIVQNQEQSPVNENNEECTSSKDISQLLQLVLKVMGKIPPSDQQKSLKEAATVYGDFFCALYEMRIKNIGPSNEATLPSVTLYDLATKTLVEINTRYAPNGSDSDATSSLSWFDTLCKNCLSECVPVAVLSIKAYLILTKKRKMHLVDEGDEAPVVVGIIRRLWDILEHSNSAFHYDTVKHFLNLERQHKDIVREELVRLLTAGGGVFGERAEACRRFSLLWRIAGEVVGPDDPRPFTPALFLMLDTLGSEDRPDLRLEGSSWLADSAAKAERVMDPLLLEALSITTLRSDGFVYSEPYDTRRVIYVLRLLRTLLEQDSGLFLGHLLKKSVSKDVLQLNDKHNEASPDFASIPIVHYADLVAVTCLRYVQGVVPESLPDLIEPNALVQSAAAELLGMFLERVGRVSLLEARRIAAAIQGPILLNMARAISSSSLVLQVALLSILKSMLRYDARAAAAKSSSEPSSVSSTPSDHPSLMSSPMFLQTLLCGILQPLSKNVRCYWLEFLACCLTLNSCPVKERALMLRPVIETLCSIINSIPLENMFDSVPCNDVIAIIKTLAVIMAADVAAHPITVDGGYGIVDRDTAVAEAAIAPDSVSVASSRTKERKKGRGLVLSQEAISVLERSYGGPEPCPAILGSLHLILYTLFSAYGAPVVAPSVGTAIPTTIIHNKYTVQDMIFRVLEPVMKQYPVEFVRTIVLLWFCDDNSTQRVAVEILSTFESASEEIVLSSLPNVCKSLFQSSSVSSSSLTGSGSRNELGSISTCEQNMYSFIHAYTKRTIGVDGLAVSWPKFYAFMKQTIMFVSSIDAALFIIKILYEYFTRVNAYDEKKGRKPLPVQERKERQDLLTKSLDTVLSVISLYLSTQSQPPAPTASDPHPEINPANPANEDAISMLALLNALVPKLLPVLSIVYEDVEKLVPMHALIAHQLIPFLKYKWSVHAEAATKYLAASCTYPFAVRAWKKDVLDVLQSQDFFEPSSVIHPGSLLTLWVPIINNLMSSDKVAFSDLLKNVTKNVTSQPSLFIGEKNGLTRGRHLRRLTYVLLCGGQDQYIQYLPQIKELIVESFKVSGAPLLLVQVYLCIRVMVIKFSPLTLLSFLPIVFTELISVFSSLPPPKSPFAGEVILSACKLVDTMLLIPDYNYAMQQWIFVQERPDSIRLSSQPDSNNETDTTKTAPFKPFMERFIDLLKKRYPDKFDPDSDKASDVKTGKMSSFATLKCDDLREENSIMCPFITARSLVLNEGAIPLIKQFAMYYSKTVYKNNITAGLPDIAEISKLILSDLTFIPPDQ